MKLISFLVRNHRGAVVFAVIASAVTGASNAGLLAVLNTILKGSRYSLTTLVGAFIVLCLALPVSRFITEILLTRVGQESLLEFRLKISRQILAAPLARLEEFGVHRLMTALTEDIPVITNTVTTFSLLCINIAMVVGGLIYLGWLSLTVLLVVLGILMLGVVSYQFVVRKALHFYRLARNEAEQLFKHFRALTVGIKELKLHRRRREMFISKVLQATAASYRRNIIVGTTIYTAAASGGQTLFFVIIAIVLFVLPKVHYVDRGVLIGYTLTLLYLMVPLQVIMNNIPVLARASVALNKMEALGLELAKRGTENESTTPVANVLPMKRLDFLGVTHSYSHEGEGSSFILGPVDLTLYGGELLFLTGGNGSGKTTLAKILTGLYVPEAGAIRLNGALITDQNREFYREHFSVVFSDYCLFESLLGLEHSTLDEQARDYLVRLQLNHKVEIKDGALSTVNLSEGQRKRLALLTAYLEGRPIYVFDEWAADQDPFFKEIFYYHLLPELKSRGKTIVVISHDDRYYHIADRIVRLNEGRITSDPQLGALAFGD
jgi:putative pyoverdin transport system ATP-binding/permease protein